MKAIGFIADLEEHAGGLRGLPTLAEVSGRLDPRAKAIVLEYLAHGTQVFDVMEATPDPLNPGRSISGGSSLVTDGEYVWRLDLSSYISAHNIALPNDFISRATAAVQSGLFPSVVHSPSLATQVMSVAGWA